MQKLFSFLIATILFSAQAFATSGGDSMGNGGDAVAADFVNAARA